MGSVGGSDGKGNGSRRRPFGMMVLIAFALALLGVLLLNKFRERRIFNLLLKEKDTDLLSLHFLLQKQVDRSRELEKTKEDLKAKLYTLRTEKIELNRRLVEMESTIEILKDEQKTLEATLEVKQEEPDDPQLRLLKNTLKEKEDQIEDLKHRLQSAANSTSNKPRNQTEIPDRVLELTFNRVADNASMAATLRRVENGTEEAIDSVRSVEVEDPGQGVIHRKEKEITMDGQPEHSEVQKTRHSEGGQKSSGEHKEDQKADHIQQIYTIRRNIKVQDSDKKLDHIHELEDDANLDAQETKANILSWRVQ